MKKFLKWTVIIFVGLIVLVTAAGLVFYPAGMKKLDQKYPNLVVETVDIPTDVDAINRGKHIATIWGCTRCHGKDLRGMMIKNDPLSGLVPLLGTISAPNLTSGNGGIATSYTDTDWVRAIRHGVMPEGEGEVLMFDYSEMSDQDLGDLIAYLKQLAPVDTNYPEMNDGPILPIFVGAGLLPPAAAMIDHNAPHSANLVPDATVEYGGYLSAICFGCHGNSAGNAVKQWKQDDFIHTFNTGVLPDGKQFGPTMSSDAIREMNDTELTALWLYFTSGKP